MRAQQLGLRLEPLVSLANTDGKNKQPAVVQLCSCPRVAARAIPWNLASATVVVHAAWEIGVGGAVPNALLVVSAACKPPVSVATRICRALAYGLMTGRTHTRSTEQLCQGDLRDYATHSPMDQETHKLAGAAVGQESR